MELVVPRQPLSEAGFGMTAPMLLRFVSEPPAGLAVLHDGQVFEISKVEPYRRADGGQSFLVTWASKCRECQVEFTFETGNGFAPRRRSCEDHKWKFGTARPAKGEA